MELNCLACTRTCVPCLRERSGEEGWRKRGREGGRKPHQVHFPWISYQYSTFPLTILSLKVAIFTYKFMQGTSQVSTVLFSSKALTGYFVHCWDGVRGLHMPLTAAWLSASFLLLWLCTCSFCLVSELKVHFQTYPPPCWPLPPTHL